MVKMGMGSKKSIIPNCITSLRLVGAVALLFIVPLSMTFYIIYTICGITDTLDGTIARKTGCTSELGARLDSIADLTFYAVMLIKVFPVLWKMLPVSVWYIVTGALVIRVASYVLAAIKYRRFSALHTWLNKITGFLVFAIPYIILLPFAISGCYVVASVAVISSGEELIIHIIRKEYKPSIKSVVEDEIK